jgi:hypothetical protein
MAEGPPHGEDAMAEPALEPASEMESQIGQVDMAGSGPFRDYFESIWSLINLLAVGAASRSLAFDLDRRLSLRK